VEKTLCMVVLLVSFNRKLRVITLRFVSFSKLAITRNSQFRVINNFLRVITKSATLLLRVIYALRNSAGNPIFEFETVSTLWSSSRGVGLDLLRERRHISLSLAESGLVG
jgi:hypothetical protein